MNFALGECLVLGSLLVAAGLHVLGLDLVGAVGGACAVMVVLALGFNRVVLRRLVGEPPISLIMVTLGLGAVIRGGLAIAFRDIPGRIPLPISQDARAVHGVLIPLDRLVAALLAAAAIVLVTWFFQASRAGVALRALADDPQAAMAMGIDPDRYISITWGLVGVLSVVAGTLWTFVAGGGFSLVLVGLKVFPIVIIGGLDSIPGTIVGAIVVGVLESLAAGYLDPLVGGGFSTIASYLVLIAVLFVQPWGLFGRPAVARV